MIVGKSYSLLIVDEIPDELLRKLYAIEAEMDIHVKRFAEIVTHDHARGFARAVRSTKDGLMREIISQALLQLAPGQLAAPPKLRNDRHYLKRKKGRA